MKLKRRIIWILIIAVLLCVVAGGMFAYVNEYGLTCSSGGSFSISLETKDTNLFSEVFADITNDLYNAKFTVEMITCQSTNDPRLRIANPNISDISQVRVLAIKRGSLTGWMTYSEERVQFFPAVKIGFDIRGHSNDCMNASDYHAFEKFQKRIRKNTTEKYDHPPTMRAYE